MTSKDYLAELVALQRTTNFLLQAVAVCAGILWGCFTWLLTTRAKDERDFF